MPDLEELGAHYRACKQATLDARKAWADAEVAGADPDVIEQAYTDVQFCKAAEVAAGEDYKGETFLAVMARHGERPSGVRPSVVEDLPGLRRGR